MYVRNGQRRLQRSHKERNKDYEWAQNFPAPHLSSLAIFTDECIYLQVYIVLCHWSSSINYWKPPFPTTPGYYKVLCATHQHGIVHTTSNGPAGGHHIAEGQDPQGAGAEKDNHDEREGCQVHPPKLGRGLLFRLLCRLGIFVTAWIGSSGAVISAICGSRSAGGGGVLPSSDRHLDDGFLCR